ncbi:glycosyltransferase [Deinococcus sp. YIM 134068]|uniref:glycosyltransferase n=1 Tax=Deinococcus lichenicola TaxID=3118910 RepID=UPI002F93EA0B
MKIALVITGLDFGGAEAQVVRMAIEYKRRGHFVTVISLTPPKQYAEHLKSLEIDVFSINLGNLTCVYREVLSYILYVRRLSPDVVHAHMFHANVFTRLMRPICDTHFLISTAHSTREGGRLRELVYTLTKNIPDLTTNVSRKSLELYEQKKLILKSKSRSIPNGIYSRLLSKRRVRSEQNIFTFLAVGRIVWDKDYPNLIWAAKLLSIQGYDFRVLIAGDGELRQEVDELINNLGLGERVVTLGLTREVYKLMDESNVFVMSSQNEGLPMALLEAATSAMPCVVTDVGGNSEIVRNGIDGFVVPPHNPFALAYYMSSFIRMNSDEMFDMGNRLKNRVDTLYGIDAIIDIWLQVYESRSGR